MEMPVDLYQLYAEFGVASEKAQLLETEAGNVALAFLAMHVISDKVTDEEREMFRSLIDEVNRKTLGALLRTVKRIGAFDQAILEAVDEALERRNYLSHCFFRSHNFAILSEHGRAEMLAELKEIQGKLSRAHMLLQGVCSTLAAVSGRSGMAEGVAAKLVEQGRRVDI